MPLPALRRGDVDRDVDGPAVGGALAVPAGVGVADHLAVVLGDEPGVGGGDAGDPRRELGRVRRPLLEGGGAALDAGRVDRRAGGGVALGIGAADGGWAHLVSCGIGGRLQGNLESPRRTSAFRVNRLPPMGRLRPDSATLDRDRLLRRRAAGAHRRASRPDAGSTATRSSRRSSATPTPPRSSSTRRCSRPSTARTASSGARRWSSGPTPTTGQPLRGAGTLISSIAVRRHGLDVGDRLLPLVGRGSRGPRPLRGGPGRWLRSRRSSPTSAAS